MQQPDNKYKCPHCDKWIRPAGRERKKITIRNITTAAFPEGYQIWSLDQKQFVDVSKWPHSLASDIIMKAKNRIFDIIQGEVVNVRARTKANGYE